MILEKIAESTYNRINKAKQKISLTEMKEAAGKIPNDGLFPFNSALKDKGISFICEVKKASPSKGMISEDFPYIQIAEEYENAGASAVSVLTEPEFFKGNNKYLKEISEKINIPILRKDFIIDEYQIYEAKIIGASAVLLISELLDSKTLQSFLKISHTLGLSALTEAHTEEQIKKAVCSGAEMIGVNNRDLNDFTVDINTSVRLSKYIPDECIFVSESGIRTAEDIKMLSECGADAVLIGETLMKSSDKKMMLNILRGDINGQD